MKFDAWLSETENFSSRFDRLLDDFADTKNIHCLLSWLRAAYDMGMREGLKTKDKDYEV